ncbi:carbohydrate ABC transporter permease [Propionibacteriaceae bacterium Y2011]|uniref:carbohydrate ABC transporter permease n=1 Tax=Microlunatus sp. Y2014 TaxID=3418488 RepID=UPI003B465AA6
MTTTSMETATKELATANKPRRRRGGDSGPVGSQTTASKVMGWVSTIIAHGFLIFWALVVLVPMIWALMNSFKTSGEIMGDPWALPAVPQFENYVRAWNTAQFGDFFVNTILIVGVSLIATLLLASLAAFALAKFRFPGRGLVFGLIVGSFTFPVVLALVPLFFIMQNLGLFNSRIGLTIVYIAFGLPFSMFFLTAFFRSIPDELMEAARVDGCSYWGTFFRIMLPLAKPGLISVGIFNFMSMWSQYILPLVLITDKDKYVLGLGVAKLSVDQGYRADWGALFAGMVIAMVPVLIVYTVFQRQVQSGITAGAVKA